MQASLNDLIDVDVTSTPLGDSDSIWKWEDVYFHITSSNIQKRAFTLAKRSYERAFLRNSFKLSNPNRTGAGLFPLVSKSESYTYHQEEPTDAPEKLDTLKKTFINMLYSKETDNNDEDAYTFLKNLLSNYPRESALLWIQTIFNENCENQEIVVGLLNLFLEFDFEELDPVAQTIAACCKNHKSYAVKTATFSLLGHWCNKQALSIITAFEEPKEMMLRIKYKKLKDIITAKCTI